MVIRSGKMIINKRVAFFSSRNHDIEFGNSRMKAFLVKLIKGKEIQEKYLKEIRINILGMSQKFGSHATASKKLK